MRQVRLSLIPVALAILGCEAGEMAPMAANRSAHSEAYAAKSEAFAPAATAAVPGGADKMPQEADAADPAGKAASAGRKIIHNAHIDVVTEDLNLLEASLSKLIAANQAYVADSDRTGSAGSTRHGSWKVRVPVDRYDTFVKGAIGLGELVSMRADSQDVTEEFFDLDARQAAKKVEEARLLRHLTESTGKLDEILTVERELSRVRSEIERMQGRLRALANLTSLTTVTLTANEIKGYVPPQAPTFGTKLARSFGGSVESLRQFGESALIGFVAIVPWLPILIVAALVIFWVLRRLVIRLRTIRLVEVISPPRNL